MTFIAGTDADEQRALALARERARNCTLLNDRPSITQIGTVADAGDSGMVISNWHLTGLNGASTGQQPFTPAELREIQRLYEAGVIEYGPDNTARFRPWTAEEFAAAVEEFRQIAARHQ